MLPDQRRVHLLSGSACVCNLLCTKSVKHLFCGHRKLAHQTVFSVLSIPVSFQTSDTHQSNSMCQCIYFIHYMTAINFMPWKCLPKYAAVVAHRPEVFQLSLLRNLKTKTHFKHDFDYVAHVIIFRDNTYPIFSVY